MGRPTEEAKTHFIGVRLTEDEYNALGENKSEYIRSLIGSNKIKVSDEVQDKIDDLVRMISLTYDDEGNKGNAEKFFVDLHDRIESGELKVENNRLKLGFSDVFKVLNTAEVKKWLKPVWGACDEKGRPYTDGLRAVFKCGSERATEEIYKGV